MPLIVSLSVCYFAIYFCSAPRRVDAMELRIKICREREGGERNNVNPFVDLYTQSYIWCPDDILSCLAHCAFFHAVVFFLRCRLPFSLFSLHVCGKDEKLHSIIIQKDFFQPATTVFLLSFFSVSSFFPILCDGRVCGFLFRLYCSGFLFSFALEIVEQEHVSYFLFSQEMPSKKFSL